MTKVFVVVLLMAVCGLMSTAIAGDHLGKDWYPATDNPGQDISGYHYNISTFGINASQVVYVLAYTSGGGNLTINATYINVSGMLDASGRGFAGGNAWAVGVGPGGGGGGSSGSSGGGGGGYGDAGGQGGNNAGSGGKVYGNASNMSIEMGSGGGGGGGGSGGAGGAGGGKIILNATTSITISGKISVNGSAGSNAWNGGGGGSGGGILLKTDGTANITGNLYARGGNGGTGSSGDGGGGGGGRIKVFTGINNTANAIISADGGLTGGNGANGRAGTITIVSWESYSDSAGTIQDDTFTTQETVNLKGIGLNASFRWDVVYYQGDNTQYNITRNQSITSGYLNLSIVPNGAEGTWHAIIYVNSSNWSNVNPGSPYIPTTYTEGDTNMSGFDSFTVWKPDLIMTQANVSFSYASSEVVETGEVKENTNVTINATVHNNGQGSATNVNVSFYGSPGSSNNIANATIVSIAAGASQNATIYWNSLAGTHNISVKVDPVNAIAESNEANNNASKLINVSAWQKYYGNVSGNLSLRDQPGNYFANWSWADSEGNVFITNVSSLNFSNLQALGRNKNGAPAQNNFSRADELLNLTPGSKNATGFANNNITQLFSIDGTNPRNNTSFVVYGNTISHVSIVNSTNATNFASVESATFITGILWDTTKDNGDGEYGDDGEDLVFIAKINPGKTGIVGTAHDYEIAIPSTLKGAGAVYFYVELK